MNQVLSSPWIPTVAMLLLAGGARLLSRSWLSPGPFALSIWSFYLLVPLALAPEFRVPAIGVWLILALVLCIAIGADLGIGKDAAAQVRQPGEFADSRKMLRLCLFLNSVGLLGGLYWAGKALKDYNLDLSLPGVLALGHFLSVERYTGGQPPLVVRVLIIWVFPAALLGGMSYAAVTKRRDRLLCLLPLVPAMLLSVIQATKANTLIAIALGLGGYLAMKTSLTRGAYRPINRKAFLALAAAVAVAVLFFPVVDAIRGHDQREEEIQVEADWGRVKFSTIGYLAVFGHWAKRAEGLGASRLSWGAYSFGGLLEATGLHARQLGVYTESVIFEGEDSNIYTAFRGLIEDFSLPGAMAVCLGIGLLSGLAYRQLLVGDEKWILGLAAFYVFLLWSPIVSVFQYNGPVLAFLVGMLAFRKFASKFRSEIPPQSLAGQNLGAA